MLSKFLFACLTFSKQECSTILDLGRGTKEIVKKFYVLRAKLPCPYCDLTIFF